jgi:O-antigen biosynthesis protein
MEYHLRDIDPFYENWLIDVEPIIRSEIEKDLGHIAFSPKISILMPTFNSDTEFLRSAINSVLAQSYQNWELCIADDNSTNAATKEQLRAAEAADRRIRVVFREENGHISRSSNSALSIATGDWVALLDHDDVLNSYALASLVIAINQNPKARFIYSDEDKLDELGRYAPFFKPDFDGTLLLGENYICHLTAIEKPLIDEVGGFRAGFEGSQDWDLFLRVTEKLTTEQILHVPYVLYHWRSHPDSTGASLEAKPYAAKAGEMAVKDHLARISANASADSYPTSGHLKVRKSLNEVGSDVDVIMPTRDGKYLRRAISQISKLNSRPNIRTVIVNNHSTKRKTKRFLTKVMKESVADVLDFPGEFNYSAINNFAVSKTRSKFICLMNDDVLPLTEKWLEELLVQMDDGVGIVGAKLLYPNQTIQHAGLVLGMDSLVGHVFKGRPSHYPGYGGNLLVAREVSAVTGACMLIRRDLWNQLGGLDEDAFPVALNDVDICLRARALGWKIVLTPFEPLMHYESSTRGPDTNGAAALRFVREIQNFKERWGESLENDPYFNVNLELSINDYRVALPPRYLDRSLTGECRLSRSFVIHSENREFCAGVGATGNFEVWNVASGEVTWSAGTEGLATDHVKMQRDGNLVAYTIDGQPLWASETFEESQTVLKVTNRGQLSITTIDGSVVWLSNENDGRSLHQR